MKTNNAESKNKTTIFHLIILDESGSMSHLRQVTIDGCNRTIRTACEQQEKFKDSQRNFVSIYAFQGGTNVPSRYLVKNAKAEEVKKITERDYEPWGNTPLYDAIGSTLIDLEAVASTHDDAQGVVTIITDGYENSSSRYSAAAVAKIIDRLKELGWIINFIGAGIDVSEESQRLHVDQENAFSVGANAQEVHMVYNKLGKSMMDNAIELNDELEFSVEKRRELRKGRSKKFF